MTIITVTNCPFCLDEDGAVDVMGINFTKRGSGFQCLNCDAMFRPLSDDPKRGDPKC